LIEKEKLNQHGYIISVKNKLPLFQDFYEHIIVMHLHIDLCLKPNTHDTPFLISTKYNNMKEYIQSLSKSSKKNYIFCKKHNNNLEYCEIPIDLDLIKKFITIWSKQLIRGRRNSKLADRGILLEWRSLKCFVAKNKKKEIIVLHLVEKQENFYDCHMPMFDKTKYNKNYLAKYMWFSLINHSINTNDIDFIDIGGGYRQNWKNIVQNRKKYEFKLGYKFMYLPKIIKENPDLEKEYKIIRCTKCGIKILTHLNENLCHKCK